VLGESRIRFKTRQIADSKLAHNAGWMFLGQGLSIFCQGIYFILLARLLGVTEYGIYAGAMAMVALVSVYSPLGSQFTFLRHVCPNLENFRIYWGNVLLTVFALGSFLVALLTWAVPHVAHSYPWTLVLCVAAADCLCAQTTSAASRVFQAFEKMRITAFLNLLTNFLRVVLAGFLLVHLHHATARQWVVAALFVSAIATGTALTLVTRLYGWPRFSLRLLRQRVGEGVVFALSYSTAGIYDNVDKAVLGHYGMNAANGIYTMAFRVIDVACVPFSSIQEAAFPRFFQKGAEGGIHSTGAFALRIVKHTAVIALLSVVVLVLSAPIIPYLVGKSFSESVLALRWLCLLPIFRSLQNSAGDALTGAGYQRWRLGTQAIAAVFSLSANLYLIPHYGWHGAAWAALATGVLLAAMNWAVLLAIRNRVPALEDAK